MKKNFVFLVCIVVLTVALSGCGNYARNAALAGAGAGAVTGQAIGKSTESTLIGAAVGMFLGYMGGNEADKYQKNYRAVPQQQYPPQQYRQPRQQNWRGGW